MQTSNIPALISVPFATSGTKYDIPVPSQTSSDGGKASFTDGFPPLTMAPIEAGGFAPYGQDFNGILYKITAVQQWQCGGGSFHYDANFSSLNGGYAKGAKLKSTDNLREWVSTVDNNMTDPDGSTSSGWISANKGKLIAVSVIIKNSSGNSLISVNGSNFVSFNGIWTPAVGSITSDVFCLGGGGGGGGTTSTTASGYTAVASGGGAGGATSIIIPSSSLSGLTITIGSGGQGVSASSGTNGGTTSVGSILTATGGAGGGIEGPRTPSTYSFSGGSTGGQGTGGTINYTGGYGKPCYIGNSSTSGQGGDSLFGSGAALASGVSSGSSAANYGAGGSGGSVSDASINSAGGAGMSGIVIIKEYS